MARRALQGLRGGRQSAARGPTASMCSAPLCFPRDRAAIADDWYVMGLRGTRSEGYSVEDLFVESRLTLDRDTPAERRLDSTLYVFPTTNVYASVFSGVALGIARAMLDDLLALAQSKSQRGARSSMRESPVIHTRFAELEARLGAARAYQRETIREVWAEVDASRDLTMAQRAPHPARDDPCHPSGDKCLGTGLPPRRLYRNLRGSGLRAPVPRRVRGLAAGPGAPHQLRDRGQAHARPRHRHDLHVIGRGRPVCATGHRPPQPCPRRAWPPSEPSQSPAPRI